jgi:thiamine pyrophosphate-dependent acetolactate synthase large subunit-like protein
MKPAPGAACDHLSGDVQAEASTMTATTKNPLHPERDSERKPDEVRSAEALAARADEPAIYPAGKASTAPAGQVEGCSADTPEDDGSYLEPPD